MSLMSSMNISQQALLVNQAAITIVSNNIANVNTDGYSRQRVNLTPGVNYTPIGGSVMNQVDSSSGVEISNIQRYTDSYLLSYFRQQNSTGSYLKQYSEVAANIEGLTNELKSSGLEDGLTKFFEAAQTLSLNPQDPTARQNYMQQAQTVALKFNDLSSNFTNIRTSLVGDISIPGSLQGSSVYGMVSQANNLLDQITKINSDIIMVSSAGSAPSSLLDKRDQLIDKLSELVPVSTTDNTNGTINLSINGIDIIKGTTQIASLDLSVGATADTPAIIQLKDAKGTIISIPINDKIDSGKIGAVLDVCGVDPSKMTIKGVMDSYDKLAGGFAGIINDIQTKFTATEHAMAIDKNTKLLINATEPIFQSTGGGPITAKNIKINNLVLADPYLIAVAKVNPITGFQTNAIGNNSNMLDVLKARSASSAALGNVSPEGSLAYIVGGIGLKNANIKSDLKNQGAVIKQVSNQLSSVTGVNMDEELIDLTKFQTAYKASSRVYTVCNELLDVLINLGR